MPRRSRRPRCRPRGAPLILAAVSALVAVAGCRHPATGAPHAPAGASREAAADTSSRAAWLAAHAAPVRVEGAPADDFADLAPFGRAISGAQVVLLGEPTHGDGSVFLLKTRLVRYLHERHGFDVVAFESPLYDAARVWEAGRRGPNPAAAARRALAPFYAASRELQPLFAYVGEEARGSRPLDVAGFDSQFHTAVSQDSLAGDLAALLAAGGADTAAVAGWAAFRPMLDTLTAGTYYRAKPSVARQRAFLATLADVRARAGGGAGGLDAAFWRQALASLDVFARDAFDTDLAVRDVARFNNARDAQMADNLLWLLRTRYPGRKVIAWGATSHLLHDARVIDTRGADITGQERYIPMGEHVRRALGGASYAIGFVASAGARGFPFPNAHRMPLPVPRRGSLEALWAATPLDAGFLDLRRLPTSGAWLRTPLTAGPLGYEPFVADWTRVLEGVFYTRTMRPSTAAAAR